MSLDMGSFKDDAPTFAPPGVPDAPPRIATILTVTPYRVVGERSQADGYSESEERSTSVVRPLQFAVVYRYETRLYNLVVTERLDEGLKRTLYREVRRDVEDRRYRESPLEAVQGQLPITFEL